MKRIAIGALALTITLGLFAPGIAQAHVRVYDTDLTLRVSDRRVDRGDFVVFSGTLSSARRRCYAHQTVQITRNGVVIATTTTDKDGQYSIALRLRRGGRYQAIFTGDQFGTHPHNHICAADSSRRIRIRVRR